MSAADDAREATRLYQLLKPYFASYASLLDLGRGTANPTASYDGGALIAGLRFFRTDYMLPIVYDGTRWVTQYHYHANFNQNATAIAGTASYVMAPIRQDAAPLIDRIGVQFFVNGVNTAGNYWNISLRGVSSNYGANSVIDTFNTSSLAGSTWINADRAPNTTTTPTNRALFDVAVSIGAGAPGGLFLSATIYYRLIIT